MFSAVKKLFSVLIIFLSSINLAFAEAIPGKFYYLVGGQTGALFMHGDMFPKWTESYNAIQFVAGRDYQLYFYELGFSYALPVTGTITMSNGKYSYQYDYEHKFYNTHFDVNRRFPVATRFNIITGLGIGLLGEKTSIKPSWTNFDKQNPSLFKPTTRSQTLQARAKAGIQYQFTEKFGTTLIIEAQGSAKNKPLMLGTNFILKYDF